MCYWLVVSLLAWGVLSLIGIYWQPLHASSAVVCLFAMAIGCFANRLKVSIGDVSRQAAALVKRLQARELNAADAIEPEAAHQSG